MICPNFYQPGIDHRELVRVYDRDYTFGVTYANPEDYPTMPRSYIPAISYITYPTVVSGMYTISTEGKIINTRTGKVLSTFPNDSGYIIVRLRTDDNDSKQFRVHRLVAYQFCNPPYTTEEDLKPFSVIHIDGDKNNNITGNLVWRSSIETVHPMNYKVYGNNDIINRAIINEGFVHAVCRLLMDGYSDMEIIDILNIPMDYYSRRCVSNIRRGYSFSNISSQYVFDRSREFRYYTDEQSARIEQLLLEGKSCKEVYYIIKGKEYVFDSIHGRPPEYRAIETIRTKLKKAGKLNY